MPTSLSRDDIKRLVEKAGALADSDNLDAAWQAAAPLREHQANDSYVAAALVALVDRQAFGREQALEALRAVFVAHGRDDMLLGAIGSALESAHDLRYLNNPPPSDPLFLDVALRLRARVGEPLEAKVETALQYGLATVSRLLGRPWDGSAEAAYLRRIALNPTRSQDHYGLGLFYKTRGRFTEGLAANRKALELGGTGDAVRWNLGICATGARDGHAALAVWKGLGQKIEMGRFGLPEGGCAAVKVRLAEHPLAERGVDESFPGEEETIWIERLSPCHGIVRSALYKEIGVDYGDVVLFDGAPITYQRYGEKEVPVFPHLATLERPGYRRYAFAGTQPREGAIAALSKSLPDDSDVYVHSEQMVMLCAHCWESPNRDQGAHREETHRVVRGKLCAPPHVSPATLREALDAAVRSTDGVRIFVPELSRHLGDHARADVEERRAQMLASG